MFQIIIDVYFSSLLILRAYVVRVKNIVIASFFHGQKSSIREKKWWLRKIFEIGQLSPHLVGRFMGITNKVRTQDQRNRSLIYCEEVNFQWKWWAAYTNVSRAEKPHRFSPDSTLQQNWQPTHLYCQGLQRRGACGSRSLNLFWNCTLPWVFSRKFAFKSFTRTSKALFSIIDFQNFARDPDSSLTTRPVCIGFVQHFGLT